MRACGVLLATALSGCASVGPETAGDQIYLGLVRVTASHPPSPAGVGSLRVRTLGGWWESADGLTSAGVGGRDRWLVSIPPECRLIVWVRDADQFNRMRGALADALKGREDLCVSTDGAPPVLP